MSGEMDAAGALATAGLTAGAIEGQEARGGHEGVCLNCGAQLTGPYCSQCGQHGHAHRKLTHVAEEFLHGILHFETKTWRTLPMVLFRPGTLTRNYDYGKRARYLSPLTLFLFSIFLMFFVFSTVMPDDISTTVGAVAEDAQVTQADLDEARQDLADAQTALAEARAHPAADEPAGLAEGLAQGAVARAQTAVDRIERQLAAQRNSAAASRSTESAREGGVNVGVSVAGEPVQPNRRWQDDLRDAVERGDVRPSMGNEALNQRVLASLRNPDLALFKIQEAASKFSFLLAPLSLPFIMLLFVWKRGVTLYDHMAYALYALSFAAFLMIAVMLTSRLPPWGGWLPVALLGLGLPVHTYFHLKGAYALGWWSALWRSAFMLLFASFILSIFIAIIIVLGLAG